MLDLPQTLQLRWVRLLNFPGGVAGVPEVAGVYAFGKVSTVAALPTVIEWVYIGESRNLKSRLGNHRAIEEANELLAAWLRTNRNGVEVWYAETDLKDRKKVERHLIRQIGSVFNKIKYKSGSD